MPVNKQKAEFRKANNLCPRDGKPNMAGRKMCERCLKKAAEKTERYRQKKIDNRLCTNCGKDQPVGGSRLCLKCKGKASEYCHNAHVKRYGKRKQSGICVHCGEDAAPGKAGCQTCLDQRGAIQNAKHDRNRADGKCSQCGGELGDSKGKRCQTCIEKRNTWYQGSTTQEKDRARRDDNKDSVFKHYGNKCSCCGEDRSQFLAIDHIENDGNIHRKSIGKYGSGFFKWLVDNDFPEGFQILCHNCNMGKHLNGGICPHKVHTVKTKYEFQGKGEPLPFDLDDE